MFNSAIFFYKFQYYQANIYIGILEIIKDFIYNTATLFVLFMGLSCHRYIFVTGALLLFITGSTASYYLFFLGVNPSLAIITSMFATHQTEVTELISLKWFYWCMFNSILCLYCIWRYKLHTSLSLFTQFLTLICLIFVLSNVIKPKYTFLKSYFPFQYLHNVYVFLLTQNKNIVKEDISLKYNFIDHSDKDVVGILVLGESARYSNFGINGYQRDTTPHLQQIENLVSYQAMSCANSTFLSIPCMLSRFGEKDLTKVDTESSLLSILTKLGFNTVWMGTQSITKYYRNKVNGSFYDEVNFHMIPGGSLIFLPNDLDGKMLPYLQQNLKNNDGKQFIIMHSTGSHWNYAARYPDEFKKYTPAIDKNAKIDPSGCSKEQLINTYDNSILYTDYFLSSVIKLLENKNAFLIYASDHGESLGEGGRLTHGMDGYFYEQRAVPMIIWFSKKYKQNHPNKWISLKSFENKVISHDYIFHSILDCIGVKSEIIDTSLSVCKKSVPYH